MGRKIKLVPNAFYLFYVDFREKFKQRIPEEYHTYTEEKFWEAKAENGHFYIDIFLKEFGLDYNSVRPSYFPDKISITTQSVRNKKRVRIKDKETGIEYVPLGKVDFYPALFHFAGYKSHYPFLEFIDSKLKAGKLSEQEYKLQHRLTPKLIPAKNFTKPSPSPIPITYTDTDTDTQSTLYESIDNGSLSPSSTRFEKLLFSTDYLLYSEFNQKKPPTRFRPLWTSILLGPQIILAIFQSLLIILYSIFKLLKVYPVPTKPTFKRFTLVKTENAPDLKTSATQILEVASFEKPDSAYIVWDSITKEKFKNLSKKEAMTRVLASKTPVKRKSLLEDKKFYQGISKEVKTHNENRKTLLQSIFYIKKDCIYHPHGKRKPQGNPFCFFYYDIKHEAFIFHFKIDIGSSHDNTNNSNALSRLLLDGNKEYISIQGAINGLIFQQKEAVLGTETNDAHYHYSYYYFPVKASLHEAAAFEDIIGEDVKKSFALILCGKLREVHTQRTNIFHGIEVKNIMVLNENQDPILHAAFDSTQTIKK